MTLTGPEGASRCTRPPSPACPLASGPAPGLEWRARIFLLTAAVAVALLATAGRTADNPDTVGLATAPAPSVRLSPDTVRMGAFYSGARLRIEGEAPEGAEVLIVIRGAEAAEFFNRKAHVGPIWVNVDRVHICLAPSLLLRLGGGDLGALLDPASIEAYGLDEAAIKSRMRCLWHCRCARRGSGQPGSDVPSDCKTGAAPDPRSAEEIRDDYVSLKAKEGAYRTYPEAVRIVESATGARLFAADLDWPRTARPGSYRVEVLACRDRSVIGRTTTVLQVTEVGFPAFVGALAGRYPTFYGFSAVLVTALAGLAADFAARRRRRHGHARALTAPLPPPAAKPGASPASGPAAAPATAQDEEGELAGKHDRG